MIIIKSESLTIVARSRHYNDVIMSTIESHITSLTIVYSTVYSGADQRKHQSSASLASVRVIHRWPVNSPHKGPVTRKIFPFDDVIMKHWYVLYGLLCSYLIGPWDMWQNESTIFTLITQKRFVGTRIGITLRWIPWYLTITNLTLFQVMAWCRQVIDKLYSNLYNKLYRILLNHWGRVTHICVGNLTIIGSDNGLSPSRRQAIIWTNAGILLIGPLGTNFSEILIEIYTFSSKKMHLKMSSGKWRPSCLCFNVLTYWGRGRKWPPFFRRRIQTHFPEWKCLNSK